ncbi:MAG: translational GTPase TypA [Planctomycetales bacterium]|jgi:GTP-binding protein|nr:translational GTPase TypA [Planctomycetales bacterium]
MSVVEFPSVVDSAGVLRRTDVRNIAIIAHVDHGKTSLVDCLIKQSGMFRENQRMGTCILDSNDLERERGITILAKNIAMMWNGVRINIIDTPGHADFGGEVERVLKMADGALLVVDAFEGPRPQTRFVLQKALECGLSLMVVINKIDRQDCRPDEVLSQTFDLLVELGADDKTLDFPYIYTSAREGYATHDPANKGGDVRPLLDLVLEKIPGPVVRPDDPLQLMVTSLEWSRYVGRIATGRIAAGRIKSGQQIAMMRADGSKTMAKVDKVQLFDNLGRADSDEAQAGDIVAVTGLPDPEIGDTIADILNPVALERIAVDEPTLSMKFTINSSPLVGQHGKFVTSRNLRDRLYRELQSNVALRVEETEDKESFKVSGRGVLHLAVLIETMRREGYELSVGKPEVIIREIDGKKCEPYELLEVDVPSSDLGPVMELVGGRRGQAKVMNTTSTGMTHVEFSIPARGLIGMRTKMLNATRGEAIMHHRFEEYRPIEGEIPHRQNGVLISQDNGKAIAYALWKLQERADLFVKPGEDVYDGMIIGENVRDNDMVVNPIREKKLTNIRSAGAEDAMLLRPPRELTLELALEYIEWDEYVEVTPQVIRLRKVMLSESERKRQHRSGK